MPQRNSRLAMVMDTGPQTDSNLTSYGPRIYVVIRFQI